jgi:TatD DNase family protein
MPLDEDHTYYVLVVARYEDCVVADEYADGGFLGDLPELHSFHDNRVPPIITDPLGVAALGGVCEPIKYGHDAIVAQDTFDLAVGHVVSWVGGHQLFTARRAQRQSREITGMLYFFDTHAHIQRSRSGRCLDSGNLLIRARQAGVRAVLAPAVDHADWDTLAEMTPPRELDLYVAWGLHPYFVLNLTPSESTAILEELYERVLNASPDLRTKLKAIGECGLDFARARTPESREHQLVVFRAHLELARQTGLPLSIHCVAAQGPLLELLRERPTPPSVMHAFSGSADTARALVEAGHYISFAANLCVPNARKVVEAARVVPDDRLLLETDTPDQTPPSRRPADNEPAFIIEVARRLAELRGIDVATVASLTWANARRVFAIDDQHE